MINTWWFNVFAYFILYIIYIQYYKQATKKSKSDGALTTLLQMSSGIIVLLYIPLFELQFPTDIKPYLFLLIACIFYAITDRANTTARRGLEVSIYSILGQTSTIFMILWGLIFFKEELIIKKIIGSLLIILGNIIVLYKKGKFEWNKYILFSIIGNIALSIGLSIDVGISDIFNLPIYVAITLFLPALIIMIFEKIKVKDMINELKIGDKKSLLIVAISWGMMIITMIRAYQFGSLTLVAPIMAISTLINVFVSYFVQKEHDSILKKIIAALIVVIGIILIKL